MADTTYEDAVAALYDLPKFTGEISLEPIRDAMAELGHPEEAFPSIHIAGTNGKGSTLTMTMRILQEAGYTVGHFPSPHLKTFRERASINGERIPKEDFVKLFEEISAIDTELSFFEATTALAFLHFARQDVDIAVVEAGLGGRLDATNVLDPEVAIITNVAKDHSEHLGNDITDIAAEKAGIITSQTPVVSGASGPAADVIRETAQANEAPYHPVDQSITRIDADTSAITAGYSGVSFRSRLYGDYQYMNMDAAVTAIELLDDFDVSAADIRSGLARTTIPGRMEKVLDRPQVFLDGGHNPAGVQTAAASIERLQRGKTFVLTSIMDNKEYPAMLETMESYADEFFVSAAEIDRAADPQDLAACITDTPHTVVPGREEALRGVLRAADHEDTVIVTGSLYFVGDVREALKEMDQ